jgi:hypothetical protein
VRALANKARGDVARAQMLARWGGMGNHRYQMGFSGDVTHTWKSLAFQPYFTATAANVLYGFWSHDIVARAGEHELQTRWIQWGALASPAFRQHDAGAGAGGCADNNPPDCAIVTSWGVPTLNFEINRAAIQARLARVPHLYTLSRELFDTGVSPVRPAYYEFPTLEEAFEVLTADTNLTTVMLGSDLAASPIAAPGDPVTRLAAWRRWVPPGEWYDEQWGTRHTGPRTETHSYDLSEFSSLARAGSAIPGAVLPTADTLGRARQLPVVMSFDIFPPASTDVTRTSTGYAYEDDGETTAYLADLTPPSASSTSPPSTAEADAVAGAGSYVTTRVVHVTADNVLTATVTATGSGSGESTYPFIPAGRCYELRFMFTAPPSSVEADGVRVPYCRFAPHPRGHAHGSSCWRWSAERAALIVHLAPAASTTAASLPAARSVTLTYPSSREPRPESLAGIRGAIDRARLAKAELDADRTDSSKRDALTQLSTIVDVLEKSAGACEGPLYFFYSLVEERSLIRIWLFRIAFVCFAFWFWVVHMGAFFHKLTLSSSLFVFVFFGFWFFFLQTTPRTRRASRSSRPLTFPVSCGSLVAPKL